MNVQLVLLIVMPILAAVFFIGSLRWLANVQLNMIALAVVALG